MRRAVDLMKKSGFISRIVKYFFMIGFSLLSLYPLIWMAFNSLKNNDEIFSINPFGPPAVLRFSNYVKAMTVFNLPLYLKNSLVICVLSIGIVIIASLMFSYATARMKWRMSPVAQGFMTIGMFIPVQIMIIPLVILVRDMNLQGSIWSLILPYTAFQLPVSTLIFYGFLRGIPYELEESAAIDGAGVVRTFIQIIIPMVKPALATVIIFNFLADFNEFYVANILISEESLRTIPLGLTSFKGAFATDWGGAAAMMVLASVPTLLIYLVFSDQVERAITADVSIKG